jgi:hypothetical protein
MGQIIALREYKAIYGTTSVLSTDSSAVKKIVRKLIGLDQKNGLIYEE